MPSTHLGGKLPLAALLLLAASPAALLRGQEPVKPYDTFQAMEDAYSYAETRRRYDIRRQLEWNDESRARLGIPTVFDNTVSWVPLTVDSGYGEYPTGPAPGVGYPGYGAAGYGAAGYGAAGYGPGIGYGGYGYGGPAYAAPGAYSGYGYNGYPSQVANTYAARKAYRQNVYAQNVYAPYPTAPLSLRNRIGRAVRGLFGLPPKDKNDRAYLALFPYYSPTPQSIGQRQVQSGPNQYDSLPVYAAPGKKPKVEDAFAGEAPAPKKPTGREF